MVVSQRGGLQDYVVGNVAIVIRTSCRRISSPNRQHAPPAAVRRDPDHTGLRHARCDDSGGVSTGVGGSA